MKFNLSKEDWDVFFTNILLVTIGVSVAMVTYYIVDLIWSR